MELWSHGLQGAESKTEVPSSQLRDGGKPLEKWGMAGGMQRDVWISFWTWEKCGSPTFKTSIFSLASKMPLGSSPRLPRSWKLFPLPNLCALAMECDYPKENLREEEVNTGASVLRMKVHLHFTQEVL